MKYCWRVNLNLIDLYIIYIIGESNLQLIIKERHCGATEQRLTVNANVVASIPTREDYNIFLYIYLAFRQFSKRSALTLVSFYVPTILCGMQGETKKT